MYTFHISPHGGLNMNRHVGFALLFASSVALGQGMTKWVDEKGKVHYGDRPPADAKEQGISKGTTSSVGVQAGTRTKSTAPPQVKSNPMSSYNEQVVRRNETILDKQRETVRKNEETGRNDQDAIRQRELLQRNEAVQSRNRQMMRQ